MFAHVASASYTRAKFYLASLQQEPPQTHHPISQDVMLMNQFYFLSSHRLLTQYRFGQVIRGNHHNYLPLSLLPPFYSHSWLISGWNRYLRQSIAISSVIWLELLLFSDNYIEAAQPHESTGYFRNSPHFLYIWSGTHINQHPLEILKTFDEPRFKEVMEKFTYMGDNMNGIKYRIKSEWYAKFDLKGLAKSRSMPYTGVIERPDL